MSSQMQCQISSDTKDLNELHKQYWWIPDETMIRPTPQILDDKLIFSMFVLRNWMSYKDFILDTHFKYNMDIEDGQKYFPEPVTKSEWNFQKSLFPYNVPNDVNHYFLWNSLYDYFADINEETINTIIKDTLTSMLNTDLFDFVWYKNPKPSIPELWHCQVFWIRCNARKDSSH
jgi:hypothetical protein